MPPPNLDEEMAMSFLDRLHEEQQKIAAQNSDPWRLPLERVHGKIDFFDGLERISSQTLLDLLEVPQRNRTAGTFRRLSRSNGRTRAGPLCACGI